MAKSKKPTLIEQGYHVYMGTTRTINEQNQPLIGYDPLIGNLGEPEGMIRGNVTHNVAEGGCGAHTIIYISLSQLDQPFSYTCFGCGKQLSFVKVLSNPPPSNIFHLFGDESAREDIVLYGLLIFNDNDVIKAGEAFEEFIFDLGLPHKTRFHSKELFNGKAREKTVWKRFSEYEILQIAKQIILMLKIHRPMYCVGIVDRHTFPKSMPSGNSHEIKILPEHLYSLAFQAAIGVIRDFGLLNTDRKLKLWADTQKTKLDYWGAGRISTNQLYKYENITPEKIVGAKPILLDAVDLFTYVVGRVKSSQALKNQDIYKDMCEFINPHVGIGNWIP